MEVVELLQSIVPESTLNPFFVEIIESGTGREFTPEGNANWTHETRPIVEAFLHARFFLEMACRYSEFNPGDSVAVPSGWAALLSLYEIR